LPGWGVDNGAMRHKLPSDERLPQEAGAPRHGAMRRGLHQRGRGK
jgi:hypothetical protein